MVYPSGAALAIRSLPIDAPAPPTFSTTTGWPIRSDSFAASGREKPSVEPPGGKGTIHLIGFDGYWPKHAPLTSSAAKRKNLIADPRKKRPGSDPARRTGCAAPA